MRTSPKKVIEKAEDILCTDNNREKYYSFLEMFSRCEVYCRPVLNKYLEPEKIKPEDIGLDAKTIKDAFGEYGIYFNNEKLIYKIFGAENSPGISSCRWLRNKSLHELMTRAVKEICDRNEELLQYMESFIVEIENQS